MRILAIQLKRIGDLVLTTPALHALKESAPGGKLTLVHTATTAPLLPALRGCVDEALVYRSGGGNAALWKAVWRGGFDLCVDFTGTDRSALLTLASRARRRVIARSTLRKSRWRRLCYNEFLERPVRSRHTVDFYLDHVSAASSAEPASPLLELPAACRAEADALLAAQGIGPDAAFIAIHPGSARPEKYWVPARWAEVIDFCQTKLHRPCVLTGGSGDPGEQAHLARIHAALRQPCADLSGRLDLLALAAVLARAAVVASVDSGPMHLAAAFRRPQVVLFGPTNPFHWRPRHERCLVLQAGNAAVPVRTFQERSPGGALDAISTTAVIDCIRQVSDAA